MAYNSDPLGGYTLQQLQQMGIGQQFTGANQQNPMLQALNGAQTNSTTGPTGFNFTNGTNQGGYFQPIQTEIGNTQTEAGNLSNILAGNFANQSQQLQGDLSNELNAGLTASVPGVEDRLQSLGLLQSGAYPDSINQQKAQILSNSILPTLTNFDTNAFNTLNAIPEQAYNTVQGLQQGSVGRGFNLQDIANQQQFQQGLANQANQTQQLSALLGLVPALLGSGGLPGLLGGGSSGSTGGGIGGSGGALGGGGGGLGGLLTGSLAGGTSPIMNALLSGGLGAGGAGLGGALGLGGAGQGGLGALGSLIGGGGAGGALGAGLGGAFGGAGGAGLGGAIGSGLNSALMNSDWFNNLGVDLAGSDSSVLQGLGSLFGF